MPPSPPSRRERVLWTVAILYTLALWASAYFVQFALDFLKRHDALPWAVGGILALFGGAALVWLLAQRPGPAELVLLAAVAGVYALLLWLLPVLQERLHLVQYGLLGGLLLAAAAARRRRRGRGWPPAAVAIGLTALAGLGDEIVQYFLPNRYYDHRDVALNAVSGALVVGVLVAHERLRRGRDRRAGEPGAASEPGLQ